MEGLVGVVIGDTRIAMREDEDRRATELRLVRQAQAGDLVAFERLYRENERKVFGLCFRLSSDPALAEELTQEVFVRAWRKLSSFRGESAFSSWLYPLTVNVALSERRSRRRRDARIVGDRGPGEPGARPALAGAGSRVRPREGDGGAASGRARRVRAARRGGPDARGDRKASGPRARDLEGAAAPRPPAAQGGARVMTCQELDLRLDDWLDGALAGDAAREVELHLAGCAACRERERQLRQLLAHAAALPRSVAPRATSGRDRRANRQRLVLVARVGRARLPAARARRGRGGSCSGSPRSSHAAGARARSHGDDAGLRARPRPQLVAGELRLRSGLAQAEREYEEAAAGAARRAAAPPRRAARRGPGAGRVPSAGDRPRASPRCREALVKEPDNPELSRMLVDTHKKKVDVLRRVVRCRRRFEEGTGEKIMRRAALVLATVLAVPAWAAAQTPVDQKRPAAPDGTVSIENMAGSIKVTGWDKPEVQVKGTVGAGGELSFEGSGKSITSRSNRTATRWGSRATSTSTCPPGARSRSRASRPRSRPPA
jgi:RNA polymerase sigma factor (sigma-70 family)